MLPPRNFFLEKVEARMKELQSNLAYMNELDIEARGFKDKQEYINSIPELVREELRARSTREATRASTLAQIRDIILKDERRYEHR